MLPQDVAEGSIRATIAPWLSVQNGAQAVDFYYRAFGAVEVYRQEAPDGAVVARLVLQSSEFWISGASPSEEVAAREPVGGGTVRMILTVADPDAIFQQALSAGAKQVSPVREEYGWRVGRVEDPFGLHWEIGRPLHP